MLVELNWQLEAPPARPVRGHQPRPRGAGSRLHQPDLVATSVGLHGRVISSAEVDVTPVGGCALQGGAQLGGLGYVVGFLGIPPKLPVGTRARGWLRKDMVSETGDSFQKGHSLCLF